MLVCPVLAVAHPLHDGLPLNVLIFAKLVQLINPRAEWKDMTMRLTKYEGQLESSLQLLLTLFIIFSRADRKPAWAWAWLLLW